jgi:HSP20 family protein
MSKLRTTPLEDWVTVGLLLTTERVVVERKGEKSAPAMPVGGGTGGMYSWQVSGLSKKTNWKPSGPGCPVNLLRGSLVREKATMLYAPAETTPAVGLRRELDRLFQGTSGSRPNGRSEWAPPVDIRETKHELTFAVELPGIKPEDVEVTAQDSVLVIRGERAAEGEGEEGRYHLVERNVGSFLRHFHLPQGVDTDKIDANFEHGVLRVRIQKAALPQPKKIRIRVGTHAGSPAQQAIGRSESRKESPKKLAGAHQSK